MSTRPTRALKVPRHTMSKCNVFIPIKFIMFNNKIITCPRHDLSRMYFRAKNTNRNVENVRVYVNWCVHAHRVTNRNNMYIGSFSTFYTDIKQHIISCIKQHKRYIQP